MPGQSSWEAPSWGTTPTRAIGGMTLGSGLAGYPSSSHGLGSSQSQAGVRTTRRRSGSLTGTPSNRTASLQGGTLRQQLQGQFNAQGNPFEDPGALPSGPQDLAGSSLGLLGHNLYNAVPENLQWPQPQPSETPAQQQLPHRSGTAASTPQTMVLSPESHSSVPNPADWDPLYRWVF